MLLCLDVGNTHILGGIYEGEKLTARFRYATHLIGTADQFGIFLLNLLQANDITRDKIKAAAVCSVVPGCDFTIKHTLLQYFGIKCFMLRAGIKTGLNIKTKQPNEVGADIIAGAIGAVTAFPNKNIIIVDMGTATTVVAVTKQRDYLGGAILPGMRLGMESLHSKTAKLMEVNIEKPDAYIGRATRESIQSGLYFGKLGALRELISGMKKEAFNKESVIVVGTGGFAQMYKDSTLFDAISPDLVLHGIRVAFEYSI